MRYIFHIIITSVLFLACANVEKPSGKLAPKKEQIEVSYIGAKVPKFKKQSGKQLS